MAKILILISGHLCMAPRPQKESEALARAGHDVTVHGVWFDPEFIERDRALANHDRWQFKPILDFQPKHRASNLRMRLQSRFARECYRRFSAFSPELLNYGVRAKLQAARQAHADLTIVHSEDGLWIGQQLLKEGFRVGVDFEDWFSKDLLPEARVLRPIAHLETLENVLIQECRYCLTTSQIMADTMAETYRAPLPTVAYNSFPWRERENIDGQIKDRRNLNIPSLHWFSQTIGPGRGLETLFCALPLLAKPVEIHLRGNYPDRFRQVLDPQIPEGWRELFFIHPTVPNADLPSRIAEHDIGLALEFDNIVSRDLTVTNKLFQYLQAGLAVIATDTQGQKEVFSHMPGCGELIHSGSPSSLADAINSFITNPERLADAKDAALVAANKFCWERQETKIQIAAAQALS